MYNIKEYNRYKYVLENIKDIIWEMDASLVFTFVSEASEETAGYKAEELVGRCMLDFLTPESKNYVAQKWRERFTGTENLKKIILYDVQFVCKDGSLIWVEVSVKPIINNDKLMGYIGVTRDISEKKSHEEELKKYIEELKYANKRLEEMATFDMLTGAYNRRKFEYFVKMSIEKKENSGISFCIIMFDIDFFKKVNDTFGHREGDRILKEITAIVKSSLREQDKVFRWGGEEFIILLPELPLERTEEIAESLRKAVEQNDFGIKNHPVTISLGIGEYVINDSIEQFVSRVDNGLLKAKSTGRNRVIIG
ncbi:sensor domain-containing diguanylate cyclase [Aminipila terrae]|uniref:Diguanylate cyclase n=1 Tax=Aminipila terrae TaxID=2697030 RepID=A0A6P1MCS6_9FIRM|nr:diguanylate cyclase [Aminipila terrae]QHI71641.1 diguanylate cyclase [Aminipila terrae]